LLKDYFQGRHQVGIILLADLCGIIMVQVANAHEFIANSRVNASNLAGQGKAVDLSSNDIISRRIRHGRKGFEDHCTVFR
jgi:hypothetical protein